MASGVHHAVGDFTDTTMPTIGGSTIGVNGKIGTMNGRVDEADGKFTLGDFSVDDDRPMKVVVIGAGFSGITAAIRFPQRIKNLDLTIYEKNAGVGGTWFLNKYPGLACDIPSHCVYQFTFEENTDWSAFYAPGPEIRAYLERIVEKYKLMRYIKLQHELIHAQYDAAEGKWRLRLRRPIEEFSPEDPQFEEFEDTADVVMTGVGVLSRWAWPDIPGLKDFKGKVIHSADWDLEGGTWKEGVKDWNDKKVGVIGVGSSALQIVPALQPYVGHLCNFVRGRTWLATPFFSEKLSEMMKRDPQSANYGFSEEDKKAFKDPEYYKAFRHELESAMNSIHTSTIRDSPMQKEIRAAFKDSMLQRLQKRPWIVDHILPDFSVACRRLTPGPGYLEAICEDNVEFVPTDIKCITETGIETIDGKHRDLDVLVCATGYDATFRFPFPIVGRTGETLQERYTPYPKTYLTLCTDGFPNWFQILGPNSGVGSGSLLVILERQINYVVSVVAKMQRERLKSIDAKKEAVADFDEYLTHYFPKTVYSEKCRSWYKMGMEGGRIVGLWPGSCLHAVRAIERPRWEDYNYEYLDGVKNRFHWLGDGSTHNEKYMVGDRAWYLDDNEVDHPPVPL